MGFDPVSFAMGAKSGGGGGGSSGGSIASVAGTASGSTVTLSKTWNEIKTLFENNDLVCLRVDWGEEDGYSVYPVEAVYIMSGTYAVQVIQESRCFNANSADGYPASTF